jgi:hypothetical protein
MLGQSSSSRLRERPFGAFCPLLGRRRVSDRSRPGPVFGGAGRVRAAGISSDGKPAAGNSPEAKSASGNGPEVNSSV